MDARGSASSIPHMLFVRRFPMKRTLIAAIVAALAVAATALAGAPATAHVSIRHQMAHCHSWSVDGNAWKASQSVKLARGGTIVFQNNDVMPHKLIQVSGSKLVLGKTANMNKIGAKFTLKFSKAGTYTFKTVAGEDYMKGMKTTGEDNVLRLIVHVN
jgi:plastocyanin